MHRLGLAVCATVVLLTPHASSAQPFPIAPPGTEGLGVFVTGIDPIVATYLGNSAAFSNDLFLMRDAAGNPGDDGDFSNDLFIFNNQTSIVGSTFNLGSFGIGTELIFRLFVQNTGQNFFTGPGARNPDGLPHARVQAGWQPQTTLVSFEDLLNLPEGDNGFNDLSFSFTNTTTNVVPEPATMSLMLFGMAALGLAGRRRLLRRGHV